MPGCERSWECLFEKVCIFVLREKEGGFKVELSPASAATSRFSISITKYTDSKSQFK